MTIALMTLLFIIDLALNIAEDIIIGIVADLRIITRAGTNDW